MVREDRIKSEPTITLSMEREQSDQTVVVKLEDSVLHKVQSLSNRSLCIFRSKAEKKKEV